jgi:hypothetical protein
MLDAPAAATGAEGRTGGKEKDKRKNDTREQPSVGLLPAPKETSKERGERHREASAETHTAARERRTATATKTTTATTATTDDASFLDASVLPTATAASLERAGALARAEAAAPLRCLRERDAVKRKGLASRKKRRRYKNGDDVFEVAADARADKCAARTFTEKDVKRKPAARRTPGEDVVVSVGIHNPAKPAMVLEEFLCLGSDSLAELKDRVTCAADEQAVEAGLPTRERRGFFFVEGVFYEDKRDVGDEGNEEDEAEGGVGGTESGEKDSTLADLETENPYAAPVAAFHASVIKDLGAGAHRRFAAPGERAFVAEASTSAREAAVAEALKR